MNYKDLLTVGCATYEDDAGLYFTLQSLHAHHPHVSYLVIDNAPKSCARSRDVTRAIGGTYLHRPDLHGTSAPRDALFRLAKTPWVMCLDSHVLLETGGLQCLLDYIGSNPESNDIIGGPLVYDDGKGISTHWRPDAPPGLWGVWDTDPRGLNRKGEAIEIPMQGLGLFAMRCAAWPGFHPLFRGFGGEEGYIHEKVHQRGGRVLCLPGLRWRHRFRHMEHGAPPPPYPLNLEDHVWNLLIGHRELGIDARPPMFEAFGKRLPPEAWARLSLEAERLQPFGQHCERKRMKLLGVFYTNNSAPLSLIQKSLGTIKRAVDETMFHDVVVNTSAWQAIPGNPFPCTVGKPDAQPGHASIIVQIRKCIEMATGEWKWKQLPEPRPFVRGEQFDWDGIVFLEHDCLYGPGYFDRMGGALATGAPVVSNLDYIGCNKTGWLAVKERHEPFHSLAMSRNTAITNLNRAQSECDNQGWALLEPQGERGDWLRLPPAGFTPTVHVNW